MVWWCPSGSPSIRSSDSPSVRSPSAHFPHFSPTCFDILSWNFAHDFVFDVLQIKFDCRHFASIFEGVMPLCELRIKVMHSFPHFSPTCFDILSLNFAYDFVSPYYRSRSNVVNLRQFMWELCLFLNLEYWKYTVFCTFLLNALTYWAEILHMTLFYCTWFCFDVLQIKFDCRQFASIFEGVMPLCELRIKVMHSFPHFSPTCFDILSTNLHMTLFHRTTDQVRMPSIRINVCGSHAPFWT